MADDAAAQQRKRMSLAAGSVHATHKIHRTFAMRQNWNNEDVYITATP